MDIELPLKAQD